MSRSWLWPRLMLLCCAPVVFSACPKPADHGRPEALNPILGGGSGVPPRSKPSENVDDLVVDLGPLLGAWPEVHQELPSLITAVVSRGSWLDEHHRAAAHGGALYVRHRPDVVAEIKVLVTELFNRLLVPLRIQVAVVEFPADQAKRVFVTPKGKGDRRWAPAAFAKLVKAGQARTVARTVMSSYSGQWSSSDRTSNQTVVSGYSVNDGALVPRTTTLASGFTVQAAAWRWGDERAVAALSGSYTGDADDSPTVSQKMHRELPRQKDDQHQWEPHDVTLKLPVRDLVEFTGQVTVTRDRWTLFAMAPADNGQQIGVLAKVGWRGAAPATSKVKTLSSGKYPLTVIPVALPTDTRATRGPSEQVFGNRRKIEDNAADWFRSRAQTAQGAQRKATFNWRNKQGEYSFAPAASSTIFRKASKMRNAVQQQRMAGPSNPGGGGGAVLPGPLERLRQEVMEADWPTGTALEFVANHVFVVHKKAVADKVRKLLDDTHLWRNNNVFSDIAFPWLGERDLESARGGLLNGRLPGHSAAAPPAHIKCRGATWSEVFVGTMHAVLAGAWAPDRASPPVQVFWKGMRLAVRPHLVAHKTRRWDLNVKQHRLEGLTPTRVANTVVQQPNDSRVDVQQVVQFDPGQSVLAGVHANGARLQGILLMPHHGTFKTMK